LSDFLSTTQSCAAHKARPYYERNNIKTFETSRLIDRTQKEIFDFVSNPINTAKWQDTIQFAEWTSDEPFGIGSTQYSITHLFDRIFVSLSEIIYWDPPNQYIFKVKRQQS
jgi:hypothetical protein